MQRENTSNASHSLQEKRRVEVGRGEGRGGARAGGSMIDLGRGREGDFSFFGGGGQGDSL